MNADKIYEFGQVYRDPYLKGGRACVFKITGPNENPTRAELDLKVHRAPEDRYDPYGGFDPKMGNSSILRIQRRIALYEY